MAPHIGLFEERLHQIDLIRELKFGPIKAQRGQQFWRGQPVVHESVSLR